MITYLVISLDTEIGRQRREVNINYPFTLIEGCFGSDDKCPFVCEVKSKMVVRYNTGIKKRNGIVGCMASHLKAYQHIIDNDLTDVVVCEDDAIKIREIDLNTLPTEVCLFSGQIHAPAPWANDVGWRLSQDRKDIIASWSQGVNEIDYKRFRWTQTNAIYIPNKAKAQELLDSIRKEKSYKGYDIFLTNRKLIKYLYYPAPLKHHDKLGTTQIGGSGNPGIIVDYVRVGPPLDCMDCGQCWDCSSNLECPAKKWQ